MRDSKPKSKEELEATVRREANARKEEKEEKKKELERQASKQRFADTMSKFSWRRGGMIWKRTASSKSSICGCVSVGV